MLLNLLVWFLIVLPWTGNVFAKPPSGFARSCCFNTSGRKVTAKEIESYVDQRTKSCLFRKAIRFELINKTYICADPESDWVKLAMREVDERKRTTRPPNIPTAWTFTTSSMFTVPDKPKGISATLKTATSTTQTTSTRQGRSKLSKWTTPAKTTNRVTTLETRPKTSTTIKLPDTTSTPRTTNRVTTLETRPKTSTTKKIPDTTSTPRTTNRVTTLETRPKTSPTIKLPDTTSTPRTTNRVTTLETRPKTSPTIKLPDTTSTPRTTNRVTTLETRPKTSPTIKLPDTTSTPRTTNRVTKLETRPKTSPTKKIPDTTSTPRTTNRVTSQDTRLKIKSTASQAPRKTSGAHPSSTITQVPLHTTKDKQQSKRDTKCNTPRPSINYPKTLPWTLRSLRKKSKKGLKRIQMECK